MSKIKAVVLEKSGSTYTVLAKNGSFRQVRSRQNAEVGEEIEIHTGVEGLPGLRVWASAVALFLFVITAFLGWNLYQAPTAVALVSVDINPRLELSIDSQGHVIKSQAQNDDAQGLLTQINLPGKPINEAINQIITQAVKQKFLSPEQNWVVIGYSPMSNKTEERMPKELNQQQILTWVTQSVENKDLNPQVAVFSLTPQEKESAQKGDLTLGEYALWQIAQKAGVEIKPEQLKETSERTQLLENSRVQTQMNVVKEGTPTQESETDQNSLNAKGSEKSQQEDVRPSPDKGHETTNDKGKGQELDKNQNRNQDMSGDEDHRKGQILWPANLDRDQVPNSSAETSRQGKEADKDHVPVLFLGSHDSSNLKGGQNSDRKGSKQEGSQTKSGENERKGH